MELFPIVVLVIISILAFPPKAKPCNPNATSVTTGRPTVSTPTTISPEDVAPSSESQSTTPEIEVDNDAIDSYEHIVISGLPFARGESYGNKAKDKIQKLIAHYKASPLLPSWKECVNIVRANVFEALQRYYPNGMEEMKGIAKGANVTLDDIIILNAVHELVQWKERRDGVLPMVSVTPSPSLSTCKNADEESLSSANSTKTPTELTTGVGAVALSTSNKYAHVLMGQNWDSHEAILHNELIVLLEVHPHPCEGIKPFVALAEAGQLGSLGLNADGLGVIGTPVASSTDEDVERGKFIPSILLPRIFLESSSFTTGLEQIIRTPRFASYNLIVATSKDEALNVELAPHNHLLNQVPLEKEILVIGNLFKSASFFPRNDINGRDKYVSAVIRSRRIEKILHSYWPRIDEKSFENAQSDHLGYSDALCSRANKTGGRENHTKLASIILNLTQRTLKLAKARPCTTTSFKYFKFKFGFSQL